MYTVHTAATIAILIAWLIATAIFCKIADNLTTQHAQKQRALYNRRLKNEQL